jgi:hypothetical protein
MAARPFFTSKGRDFESAVLWDPTAKPIFKKYGGRRFRGLCLLPGAWEVVLGQRMFVEDDVLDSVRRLREFPVPTNSDLCWEQSSQPTLETGIQAGRPEPDAFVRFSARQRPHVPRRRC